MKKLGFFILLTGVSIFLVRCASPTPPGSAKGSDTATAREQSIRLSADTVIIMTGINSKGIGRFKDVVLTHPLDERMVKEGKTIFETKCFACHKLSTELLVGPGWAGVTDRRKPEWIMNWITNTKIMVDKDLAAQADLAICLIRMPNQDLTDDQARQVLEFMRSNDGKK